MPLVIAFLHRLSWPDLVLAVGLCAAAGTLCHLAALQCARRKWSKLAQALDLVALVLGNVVAIAKRIVGMTGRTLDVPSVAQTIQDASKRAGVPLVIVSPQNASAK